MIREVKDYLLKHPIVIVILVIAWLINLSFVFPIQAHFGHDTFWHLALINIAFDTFPPQVPIFAGETLAGYNYLLDLIIYALTLVGVSATIGYIVIIPFVYLISTSILGIIFAKRYGKSVYYVSSFIFFIFLATPFSYILSYMNRGSLFFAFQFPTTMQSVTALTNLAHAMTVPLILGVLILLLKKTTTIRDVFILSLLVALGFGIKFYGGVVLGLLVGTYFFINFIQTKDLKTFIIRAFIISIPTLATLIFFYDPFSSTQTGSIFSISPLATVHPLIEDPDAFYMPTLVLARYSLIDAGGFSPRLMAIELFTVILYVVYNAGTRIIGFTALAYKTITKKLTAFDTTIIIAIVCSGLFSMFLVQKGGDWWNTVQFFAYTLILLNIYAADSLSVLLSRKSIQALLVVGVIIILTLPLDIEMVMRSIQEMNKPHGISVDEQEALRFLKDQEEDGIVFAIPVHYNSAYVPAFTHKPSYYADENVLTNIGVDYEERKKEIADLEKIDYAKLDATYIYYLIDPPQGRTYNIDTIKNLLLDNAYEVIFSNEEVIVYKK